MNYFFFILIVISVCFIILNNLLKKHKILIDSTKFSDHKKFTKEENVPFSGGIFFLFVIFFLLGGSNLTSFVILFLVFLLGIFSDLNKITSPSTRILLQSLLIISYVIINDLIVINTRLTLFDDILYNYRIVAVLFTFFLCNSPN